MKILLFVFFINIFLSASTLILDHRNIMPLRSAVIDLLEKNEFVFIAVTDGISDEMSIVDIIEDTSYLIDIMGVQIPYDTPDIDQYRDNDKVYKLNEEIRPLIRIANDQGINWIPIGPSESNISKPKDESEKSILVSEYKAIYKSKADLAVKESLKIGFLLLKTPKDKKKLIIIDSGYVDNIKLFQLHPTPRFILEANDRKTSAIRIESMAALNMMKYINLSVRFPFDGKYKYYFLRRFLFFLEERSSMLKGLEEEFSMKSFAYNIDGFDLLNLYCENSFDSGLLLYKSSYDFVYIDQDSEIIDKNLQEAVTHYLSE